MRIVLKISGESLKGKNNIDGTSLELVYKQIIDIKKDNELIIVVGGGNFWRGRNDLNIDSNLSDYIGMLGTDMNALAIASYLNKKNIPAESYSAFEIEGIIKKANKENVISSLKENKIIVLGGGQGVPNYSTDMTTVSKAIKIPDSSYVILQGNIEKQLGDDKYLFKDATGTITVDIDKEKWEGQVITPKDKTEISGELDKKFNYIKLDVDKVKKLNK